MTLYLQEKLLKRKKLGNLRTLQVIPGRIDFSSNDYLGLARSLDFSKKVNQEILLHTEDKSNGIGSTGSRLLTGNSKYAQDLEEAIALFHGYEAGLIFNNGYMANLGLISAIMGSEDHVFFDSNIHTSMHDGIRLSRARAFPFKHNHVEHLEKRLKQSSSSRNRFICIESIYSTDGSKAPLSQICRLAKKYTANVIVDEAHAVGVYGLNGSGLVAEQKLNSEIFAQVTTFGKALGTHGAIVLGTQILKQALINFANSYIYTTALPLHTLAAIKCSYEIFPTLDFERQQLKKLIQIFCETHSDSSETHIQSLLIEGNESAKSAAKWLFLQGYDVRPLLSPTVQRGREMLRISLHAFNQEEELKLLLDHVRSYRSSFHE